MFDIISPPPDNKTTKTKTPITIPCFLVPKPPFDDHQALQRQKFLLAKALWTRNLMFDDNLYYSNIDCPKKFNEAALEPNLEVSISIFSFV
jgi:hypothetical protein